MGKGEFGKSSSMQARLARYQLAKRVVCHFLGLARDWR